jgi:hypothetical protein
MSAGPRRSRRALLALLLVPVACDACKEPDPGQDGDDFDLGFPSPDPFCPHEQFEKVTPAAALVGPLFAWVSKSEREAIEAGGAILPAVATFAVPDPQLLAARTHDGLPGSSPLTARGRLVSQPRVGRNFWTFAFSAPRPTQAENELLAIWLRPDAWLSEYDPAAYRVLDRAGRLVPSEEATLTPGRIAGIDTRPFAVCERAGVIERAFVVFREEAIERWRFGAEADAHLDGELVSLDAVLDQVRSESELNPVNAFAGLSCGATLAPGLCFEDTYFQALAWPTDRYLPTVTGLARLIDDLQAVPVGTSTGADRTSVEHLDAWAAVWPGPWQPSFGSGGSSGGSGSGGFGTGGFGTGGGSSGGAPSGGAGGLGGAGG